MITARITGSDDFLLRDRVRVVASFDDGRDLVILGRNAEGYEYQYRPSRAEGAATDFDPPEGVSLYALDVRTDVARAVFLALKERFEPEVAGPTATDRAYADARQDIERAHGLIDKLVDVVARPPVVIAGSIQPTDPA